MPAPGVGGGFLPSAAGGCPALIEGTRLEHLQDTQRHSWDSCPMVSRHGLLLRQSRASSSPCAAPCPTTGLCGSWVGLAGHCEKQEAPWLNLLGICCSTKTMHLATGWAQKTTPAFTNSHIWGNPTLYPKCHGPRSQRKLPRPSTESLPHADAFKGTKAFQLHRAGLEMEGLYVALQGDHSESVTIETVATIHCPSPLDERQERWWVG